MIKHTHFTCAYCNQRHYGKQNMYTTYDGKLACFHCSIFAPRPEMHFFKCTIQLARSTKQIIDREYCFTGETAEIVKAKAIARMAEKYPKAKSIVIEFDHSKEEVK